MTIGIIYIATGNYIEFFTDYYDSAERNFIPEAKKIYFVFTDREHPYLKKENVYHIPQHQEYWPYAVLHKFHYILETQHLYKDINLLVVSNANIIFKHKILINEILSELEKLNGIFGVSESLNYKDGVFKIQDNVFEENPKSCAYVPPHKRTDYFCTGFFGGLTSSFLNMCIQIRDWIEKDLSQGIYAKWDDQAYFNKYVLDKLNKNIKILSPSYCYLEGLNIQFPKKIFVIQKEKLKGSKNYYRRYSWQEEKKIYKNNIQKYRHYLIYYIIKFLKKIA